MCIRDRFVLWLGATLMKVDMPVLYTADFRYAVAASLGTCLLYTSIYCATRKAVDEVHDLLKRAGLRAGRYHAGI